MGKLIRILREYGLVTAIRRTMSALPNRIESIYGCAKIMVRLHSTKNQIYDILTRKKYDYIDVCDVSFGWDKGLFQRPQQMAAALSKMNVLVLYSIELYDKERFSRPVREINDNLIYINYKNIIIKTILQIITKRLDVKMVYHVYSTNDDYSYNNLDKMIRKHYNIVYEYIDSIDISKSEYIKQRHNCIIDDKRISIITTSQSLHREVLMRRMDVKSIMISNGVDIEHWKTGQNIATPGKCVVGYFGALAPDWFDYNLVKFIAKKDNREIVLIGPLDYTGPSGIKPTDFIDDLKIYRNIKVIDKVPYEKLPSYAAKFDVCIIPFKINSITVATSPIKLFEYFGMSKPVVTTDMPECVKYSNVLHSNDYDRFSELIDMAHTSSFSNEYCNSLLQIAVDNSWQKKAKELRDYVEAL